MVNPSFNVFEGINGSISVDVDTLYKLPYLQANFIESKTRVPCLPLEEFTVIKIRKREIVWTTSSHRREIEWC